MARTPDKPAAKQVKAGNTIAINRSQGWLYGLLAALILVMVFLAGAAMAHHQHDNLTFAQGGFSTRHVGNRHVMRQNFDTWHDGQDRVTGVVTNVNGSNFTIAAYGSTTNVTTNGSTRYHGGDQIKQNDTVAVFGTTSNGTLTATEVIINP
jgi:hypothetical protein